MRGIESEGKRRRSVVGLVLAVLVLGGCAEDGSMLGGCEGDAIEPTLASIQENVFTPICSACHFPGGTGPMPLNTEAASYDSLVNAGFSYTCAVPRVTPGEPDNSCIVLKIEATELYSGTEMPPPPLPALDSAQIGAIREWILQGAASR